MKPAFVTDERWAEVLAHAKRHFDEGLVDNDVALLITAYDDERKKVDEEARAKLHWMALASQSMERAEAMRAAYEAKVQDFARETLRSSTLAEAGDVLALGLRDHGHLGTGFHAETQGHKQCRHCVALAKWEGARK